MKHSENYDCDVELTAQRLMDAAQAIGQSVHQFVVAVEVVSEAIQRNTFNSCQWRGHAELCENCGDRFKCWTC